MRTFIALKLPEKCQPPLHAARARLQALAGAQKSRWIAPHNWHLTLRFLGNVTPAQVSYINSSMAEITNIGRAVRWQGTCFSHLPSDESPKVCALEGPSDDGLAHLQQAIAELAVPGLGASSSSSFRPHISLARTLSPLPLDTSQCQLATPIDIEFDEVVLYQSVLGPAGAEYVALSSWRLSG